MSIVLRRMSGFIKCFCAALGHITLMKMVTDLMVAEDGHLSVGSVVAEHLGGNVVAGVSQLVQLLLQREGGVECPMNEFISILG